MSRKKAIEDFCRSCITDSADKGTWRQQVERCRCTRCPLYSFRPVTTGKKVDELESK